MAEDTIYRFFYLQPGETAWEYEDYYDAQARLDAFMDSFDSITAFGFMSGQENELPDEPVEEGSMKWAGQ